MVGRHRDNHFAARLACLHPSKRGDRVARVLEVKTMRDKKRRLQIELVDPANDLSERLARVGEAPLNDEVVIHHVIRSQFNVRSVRRQAEQDHHASSVAPSQRARDAVARP